jgi:hypothetical protein
MALQNVKIDNSFNFNFWFLLKNLELEPEPEFGFTALRSRKKGYGSATLSFTNVHPFLTERLLDNTAHVQDDYFSWQLVHLSSMKLLRSLNT